MSAETLAGPLLALLLGYGLGSIPFGIILTRLGVDVSQQGRGLGSGLVADALQQVASIADRVGVRALLIHAEAPEAARTDWAQIAALYDPDGIPANGDEVSMAFDANIAAALPKDQATPRVLPAAA